MRVMLLTVPGALMAFSGVAQAQSDLGEGNGPQSADSFGVSEIVVTAQKRSESANKVGMSITAISGDSLMQRGITSTEDLIKVVPGFQQTEAPRGTPVYAIRGIGFDDSTLGSNSTVALYSDEVPISFAPQARFATLDLERVEVLKGPQGTLFGQNSTAGAINFIAAKPRGVFEAGFDASYGRFNTFELRGFVSGGLSDTLSVRVAGMTAQSSGWQKSYTRDDELGDKRQYAGRFIAKWEPISGLTSTLTVNGWIDKSDTQAVQLIEAFPNFPATVTPAYDAYPRAPRNARAADWDENPIGPLRRDDNFLQISLRNDLDITDNIILTTITSWNRYRQDFGQDVDGSALQDLSIYSTGKTRSFNQEVRLSGETGQLRWIAGGNYSRDRAVDDIYYYQPQASANGTFFNIVDAQSFSVQPIRTYAFFGNAEYQLSDVVKIYGGVRYTKDKRSYAGCTADPDTDGTFADAFNIVYGLTGTPGAIPPGGCITSTNFVPGLVESSLTEDNISWKVGLDAQVTPDILIYANVGRGYKSGSFPNINAASSLQLDAVSQESVLAYETGFKASLLGRSVQLNGAAFYNDYEDKQLRGRVLDPFGVFGVLDTLLNIPKSRVYGAELSIDMVPFRGLTANVSGTYVNSRVTGDFFGYDPVGNLFNYRGLAFPHTPKWNFVASLDYERSISNQLEIFVGGNITYQSKTTGLFNRPDLIGTTQASSELRAGVLLERDIFRVKDFTVVDARLGLQSADDKWRAWIWGKNIFNTYYWSNVTQSLDTIYRIASRPATYGVSASFRF